MSKRFIGFMFWFGAVVTLVDCWLATVCNRVPVLRPQAEVFLICASLSAIGTVSNYLFLRTLNESGKTKS
jgi:hypothetical protein